MEKKDIIFILIAFLGWSWGIIQFIINCRTNRINRQSDRRYLAYSAYMKKIDEIMNNVRTDPNMIYGISTDFLKVMLNGDDEERDNAVLLYNEKLLDFVKKATEPILIVRQELNALLIVCSNKLYPKISELIDLTTDFNNEMVSALNKISPRDPDDISNMSASIRHFDRLPRFKQLNDEIIEMMRKELAN